MSLKKTLKSLKIPFLTLLVCSSCTARTMAQKMESNERAAIRKLTTAYKQFYDNARMEPDSVDILDFRRLFSKDPFPIFNDYYDEGTNIFPDETSYFDDFEAFMLHNEELVEKIDWQIFDEEKTYYAVYEQAYFAWVRKRFQYRFDGKEKIVDTWARLTIRWINDQDGYKIVGIDRSQEPDDEDHDGIPDVFDDCLGSSPRSEIGINGCEIKEDLSKLKIDKNKNVSPDLEQLYQKLGQQYQELMEENRRLADLHYKDSIRLKEKKRIKSYRVRPSSRFSLELTGGGVYPMEGSFVRQDLLDYKTNTWKDSGSLAGKYGYTGGLSLHYNINKRIGISIGYQHFFLPFAKEQLELQIKNYLANEGIDYGPISISSDGWRLHLLYATVCGGNFERRTHSFGIEPLIGIVRTDMVWDNRLNIEVSSNTGSPMMANTVSLRYDPFMVFGGKLKYQWDLGHTGNVRFQISAEYLQGRLHAPSHQIIFDNPSGVIVIPAPDLKMLNMNAGFHFTLHHP